MKHIEDNGMYVKYFLCFITFTIIYTVNNLNNCRRIFLDKFLSYMHIKH